MKKQRFRIFFAAFPFVFFFTLLLASNAFSIPEGGADVSATPSIQAAIQSRILEGAAAETISCQGEVLCGVQLLASLYGKRNYQPLWSDAVHPTQQAMGFVEAIERASEDGLDPSDYYLASIRRLLSTIQEQQAAKRTIPVSLWVELDLLLTDTFLLYASHLSAGRVNPETLHSDWKVSPDVVSLRWALDRITTPEADVDAIIDSLRPPYPEYRSLQKALAHFRTLLETQGEWPKVPTGQTLRPGDRHSAICILRRRLIMGGDLAPEPSTGQKNGFDTELVKAVKRFQRRNGLRPDGVVGPDTFRMLNVPIENRIRQIILNLERWRWRPRQMGNRYVMVNTADFNLKAVANNTVVLDMRVVVGRPARRSPVFSAEISYLVVNPYWNVPTTIAVEDFLPKLQAHNFSYFETRKIRIFQSWAKGAEEVDPKTVDWNIYHADRFPFRLRQDPGPRNSLGRIKFMFPNPFAVYLHDTPNHALFDRVRRNYSSGCIRVEFPMKLADFVLAETPDWPREKVMEALKSEETRTISLRHPVPIHLLYMTAWTDASGILQFREDIYSRDSVLQLAFDQRRPQLAPGLAVPSVVKPETGKQ